MAKNGLNKELDFIVSVLKQRRIVPEQQPREKFISLCVCFFSLLVLRVSLGFDCTSS